MVRRASRHFVKRMCALALIFLSGSVCAPGAHGQQFLSDGTAIAPANAPINLDGVHEPRLGIVAESEQHSGTSFWDGTLGGRVGLLRYGTVGGILPQGYELDVEAAAMVRLTLDQIGDFETADYRYGVPLTYGV